MKRIIRIITDGECVSRFAKGTWRENSMPREFLGVGAKAVSDSVPRGNTGIRGAMGDGCNSRVSDRPIPEDGEPAPESTCSEDRESQASRTDKSEEDRGHRKKPPASRV